MRKEFAMNLAIHRGDTPPAYAVSSPQLVTLAAIALLACGPTDAQVTKPAIVGMTDNTPVYYSDGNTTIYEVQIPVMLPMRAPDASDKSKLGAAPTYLQSFGATKAPWILASDVQTTLTITLTNIDDQPHIVELLVDPWNEYVKYKPGIQVISDEETLPDFSGYDRFYELDSKARVAVTLVPDDTSALAQNLATVMNISVTDPTDPNGNGLFNHTFDLQNRPAPGETDPLVGKFVPPANAIPAMVGFDIGLRTSAAMNVAVEVSVDVQDMVGRKVLPTTLDSDNQPLQAPGATLSPPKAPVQM
jgi:hypothetical protein